MIRAGYFPNFKDRRPTVLFWGNADGMRHLISMLGKLPAVGGQFRMGDFANDAPALVMRSATTSLGMQRRQGSFEWILEPKAAADFRDKVPVLAEANLPGHQYLECGATGEIIVVVSCGEYPADLKP